MDNKSYHQNWSTWALLTLRGQRYKGQDQSATGFIINRKVVGEIIRLAASICMAAQACLHGVHGSQFKLAYFFLWGAKAQVKVKMSFFYWCGVVENGTKSRVLSPMKQNILIKIIKCSSQRAFKWLGVQNGCVFSGQSAFNSSIKLHFSYNEGSLHNTSDNFSAIWYHYFSYMVSLFLLL